MTDLLDFVRTVLAAMMDLLDFVRTVFSKPLTKPQGEMIRYICDNPTICVLCWTKLVNNKCPKCDWDDMFMRLR